jgi:17beta-estradiol 17-dehydrogenase / very-long-chain 3-oxoacyl-CoA reductase
MDYVVGFFGSTSENAAMRIVDGMHVDIRKRALKKKAREAEKSKSQ